MTATDGLQDALERATGRRNQTPDTDPGTDPGTDPPALNSTTLENQLRAAVGAHPKEVDE